MLYRIAQPVGLSARAGCEWRTLPRSTTRVDDIGQGLLSFYKPPSLREELANRANAPLQPSKAQKVLPRSGLFGRERARRDRNATAVFTPS
jgi:hypothetical protein